MTKLTLHDFDILFGAPRKALKALSTDAHLVHRHDNPLFDVPRVPFGDAPCIVGLDSPPGTVKWQRA